MAHKEIWQFRGVRRHYAQVWSKNVRAGREFGALYPERYCEVRYEDLLADSNHALSGVLHFLGASNAPVDIDACVKAGSFEHVTKGRSAGSENRESHFRKIVQGDWHEHFDAHIHTGFRRHSGDLLDELGYDTSYQGDG